MTSSVRQRMTVQRAAAKHTGLQVGALTSQPFSASPQPTVPGECNQTKQGSFLSPSRSSRLYLVHGSADNSSALSKLALAQVKKGKPKVETSDCSLLVR